MAAEPEPIELTVPPGVLVGDVRDEVTAALKAVRGDAALLAEVATRTGQTVGDVEKALAADEPPITVEQKESGVGVVEGLIVAFTPLAVEIATDLWRHIVFPRIRRRFGLKDEKTDEKKEGGA